VVVAPPQPQPGDLAWRRLAGHGHPPTHQTLGLVELRLAVDPEHSRRDRLVLRGRGVLDRRTFPTSKPAWSFDPTIRLDLAARQTSRKEAG
jgi:hypothetical protein